MSIFKATRFMVIKADKKGGQKAEFTPRAEGIKADRKGWRVDQKAEFQFYWELFLVN